MLSFLQQNWVTIVTLLVIALIVFLAVRRVVLDKKRGTCACGQQCAHCAMHCACAQQKRDDA